ncbi:MAG: hypothetical protein ACK4NF_04200 [Planctomycetota bacterium]
MEVGGISNIGPIKNVGRSVDYKVSAKVLPMSDSIDISEFLALRKAIESATPANEIKAQELKKILEEKGKLEFSEEQLARAINNFLDEIFS